jgi:hypothetical protein
MLPPGWRGEVVRRDAETVLYRGRSSESGAPFLLVTSAAAMAAPEQVARLGHELSLRPELDPRWALQPVEIVPAEGGPVLLLADPGGQFLHHLLPEPMEIRQSLELAIAIATALASSGARKSGSTTSRSPRMTSRTGW